MTSIEFVLKTSFALLDNNERKKVKKVSSGNDEECLRWLRRKTEEEGLCYIYQIYTNTSKKEETCLMWYYYITFSSVLSHVGMSHLISGSFFLENVYRKPKFVCMNIYCSIQL